MTPLAKSARQRALTLTSQLMSNSARSDVAALVLEFLAGERQAEIEQGGAEALDRRAVALDEQRTRAFQVVGEGRQFDQRAGTLALCPVIGKAFLPIQLAENVLLDQRIIARNARLDDIQLLHQFVQEKEDVLQRLVDGFVGGCALGHVAVHLALPCFGLAAQLIEQAAAGDLRQGRCRGRRIARLGCIGLR